MVCSFHVTTVGIGQIAEIEKFWTDLTFTTNQVFDKISP
jgi:hypothetical protein